MKEDFLSISIKTGNTAYDGNYYKFNIWCNSTRSTLPSGKAKVQLEISLRNKCYDTVISAPIVSSSTAYLYSTFVKSFTPSTQSITSCNEITYTLELMNTDANKPALFGFNSDGQIVTTPISRDNSGLYNF